MPEMILREAIAGGLREALENDDRVFIMGEDIGAYGGAYAVTRGFLEEFGPDRIKDTPLAESVIVGTAVGAAGTKVAVAGTAFGGAGTDGGLLAGTSY